MAEYIPNTLQTLARQCGEPVMLALVEAYGGTELYVPHTPSNTMVELLGNAGSTRLCQQYGGVKLYIPRASAALRYDRDLAIRAARRKGASITSLATTYQLTRRQISTICSATNHHG